MKIILGLILLTCAGILYLEYAIWNAVLYPKAYLCESTQPHTLVCTLGG